MVGKENERNASVKFVQTTGPESWSHLKRRGMKCIRTLQKISKGEELVVDYGTS